MAAKTKQQKAIGKWNKELFNEGVRQGKSGRLNVSYDEAKENVKEKIFKEGDGLGRKPRKTKKSNKRKTTAKKITAKKSIRKPAARKTTAKRRTAKKSK